MNPCELKLSNELHSLIAEFKSFRELMAERDVRYMGMFTAGDKAVSAALAAAKEQTRDAFNSSEKAIVKAEEAQKSYNASHNDLARKMDEQNKATMPRMEIDSRFKNLEEKLALLTGSFSAGSGAQAGAREAKDDGRANISILVSIISVIIAVGSIIFGIAKAMP